MNWVVSKALILTRIMQIESAHRDGSVIFTDGSVVVADVILHCTGYALSLHMVFDVRYHSLIYAWKSF